VRISSLCWPSRIVGRHELLDPGLENGSLEAATAKPFLTYDSYVTFPEEEGRPSRLHEQEFGTPAQMSMIMSSSRVGYEFRTSPLSLRTTTVSE
jgi:hypothetical protein